MIKKILILVALSSLLAACANGGSAADHRDKLVTTITAVNLIITTAETKAAIEAGRELGVIDLKTVKEMNKVLRNAIRVSVNSSDWAAGKKKGNEK